MGAIRPVTLLFSLSALPGLTFAQTATDTFTVTAEVIDACNITANDLDFGNYSAIAGTNLDATSTVEVTCTNGTSYTVELDQGTTVGGTLTTRLLTDGSDTLDYNLYTTNARTSVWGDGTSSSVTVPGAGSGALQSLTVYGRIPASQNVAIGSYSDTVTATINF